jgi:predicted phosphodiesterase
MTVFGKRKVDKMKKNRATRRVVGYVVLAALLFGAYSPMVAAADKDFRFVVMGDNRPGKEDPITPTAEYIENIKEINLLAPDLVLNNGDLIKGYVEDEAVILQMWSAFEAATAKFEMPFYRTFGNHDVWNETSQRIAHELYDDLYGDLYYSFTHKDAYFAVLCSDFVGEMDQITGKQLEWFKKDLRRNRKRAHKFVVVHKPLWQFENSNWLAEVQPLLAQYKVDMVFAGHAHKYERSRERDGVRYYITGGGGAPLRKDRTPEQGWFFHYLHVSVRGEEIKVAVVKTGGVKDDGIVTYETK